MTDGPERTRGYYVGEPTAEWTESEPVPDDASPASRCDACGRKLMMDEERKEFSAGGETTLICWGGCPPNGDDSRSDIPEKQTPGSAPASPSGGDTDSTEVTSRSQQVVCHECGKTVRKRVATGKYRINDGKTVWFCPSCE